MKPIPGYDIVTISEHYFPCDGCDFWGGSNACQNPYVTNTKRCARGLIYKKKERD